LASTVFPFRADQRHKGFSQLSKYRNSPRKAEFGSWRPWPICCFPLNFPGNKAATYRERPGH
jgi:hypothetical protein